MRDLLLGLQLHLSLKLNFTEILSLLHSTVDSHMSPIQAGKEMFRYTSSNFWGVLHLHPLYTTSVSLY
jgi:hypothetical protein